VCIRRKTVTRRAVTLSSPLIPSRKKAIQGGVARGRDLRKRDSIAGQGVLG